MRRAEHGAGPVSDGATLHALVEYCCAAHPHPGGDVPRYSIVDGAWAYCAGHGRDGHRWTRIEPTRPGYLGILTESSETREH
jgi:hypothetical protein